MARLLGPAVLLCVAGLALAGCGSTGSGWTSLAQRSCGPFTQAVLRIGPRAQPGTDDALQTGAVDLPALAAVKPPAAQRVAWKAYLGALGEQFDAVNALDAAQQQHARAAGVNGAQLKVQQISARAFSLAKTLGLAACTPAAAHRSTAAAHADAPSGLWQARGVIGMGVPVNIGDIPGGTFHRRWLFFQLAGKLYLERQSALKADGTQIWKLTWSRGAWRGLRVVKGATCMFGASGSPADTARTVSHVSVRLHGASLITATEVLTQPPPCRPATETIKYTARRAPAAQQAARPDLRPIEAASTPVRGLGFQTGMPAGWSVVASDQANSTNSTLISATGAPLSRYGMPVPGDAGLVFASVPFAAFPRADRSSLARLLRVFAAPPPGAASARVAVPASSTTLDGERALTWVLAYSFKGRPNLQEDVLAVHDGTVFVLEVDAAPQDDEDAQLALNGAHARWRWADSAPTGVAG